MTNGNSIILYIHHGRENQIFYLVYNSDNTVTFKNKNYAIDVKNCEAKNGSVIQLYEYNETLAQKFYLVDSGIGYYDNNYYILKYIHQINHLFVF